MLFMSPEGLPSEGDIAQMTQVCIKLHLCGAAEKLAMSLYSIKKNGCCIEIVVIVSFLCGTHIRVYTCSLPQRFTNMMHKVFAVVRVYKDWKYNFFIG